MQMKVKSTVVPPIDFPLCVTFWKQKSSFDNKRQRVRMQNKNTLTHACSMTACSDKYTLHVKSKHIRLLSNVISLTDSKKKKDTEA